MNNFPEIEYILSTVFSIETGLPDDAAIAFFQRILQNHDLKRRLEQELIRAFSSSKTPWKMLLSNDRYEVFEAETDDEARNFIAKMLWEYTFPGKVIPASQ